MCEPRWLPWRPPQGAGPRGTPSGRPGRRTAPHGRSAYAEQLCSDAAGYGAIIGAVLCIVWAATAESTQHLIQLSTCILPIRQNFGAPVQAESVPARQSRGSARLVERMRLLPPSPKPSGRAPCPAATQAWFGTIAGSPGVQARGDAALGQVLRGPPLHRVRVQSRRGAVLRAAGRREAARLRVCVRVMVRVG